MVFKMTSHEEILKNFKKKYPSIELNFDAEYAPILRAYVSRSNADLGNTVQRAGATKTMFRNFGLNFLLLALVIVLGYIQSPNSFILIAGFLCSVALSLVSFSEYAKWDRWYHQITYECVIAIALDKTNLVRINGANHTPDADKNLLETFLSKNE
jgi:hypothetical protein